MKFNAATAFLLFALTVAVSQVACEEDEDDDTSVVDAADLGEDSNFPYFENNPTTECRETEEYSRCDANPDCQRNCFNLEQDGIACPRGPQRSCIEGCVCKKNYVRSQLYGGCIPVDQCNRVKH